MLSWPGLYNRPNCSGRCVYRQDYHRQYHVCRLALSWFCLHSAIFKLGQMLYYFCSDVCHWLQCQAYSTCTKLHDRHFLDGNPFVADSNAGYRRGVMNLIRPPVNHPSRGQISVIDIWSWVVISLQLWGDSPLCVWKSLRVSLHPSNLPFILYPLP